MAGESFIRLRDWNLTRLQSGKSHHPTELLIAKCPPNKRGKILFADIIALEAVALYAGPFTAASFRMVLMLNQTEMAGVEFNKGGSVVGNITTTSNGSTLRNFLELDSTKLRMNPSSNAAFVGNEQFTISHPDLDFGAKPARAATVGLKFPIYLEPDDRLWLKIWTANVSGFSCEFGLNRDFVLRLIDA